MYKITVRGDTYTYATLDAALAAAKRVYEKSGVVVGIEPEPTREEYEAADGEHGR